MRTLHEKAMRQKDQISKETADQAPAEINKDMAKKSAVSFPSRTNKDKLLKYVKKIGRN